MDKKSLERNYRKIEDCVLQGKLKDALDMLKDLVLNSKKGEFVTQYDNLDDTYENLLKYSIEGLMTRSAKIFIIDCWFRYLNWPMLPCNQLT